jgi:hypothetical protein
MTKLALALVIAAALVAPATASAAPEVRTAAGATPAALDPAVAAFRADVGAARREIDWDGAPTTRLPGSFFQARGAQLDTPGLGGEVFDPVGPTWGAGMKPYSGKQLFTPVGSNVTDVRFTVPGSSREATTTAFGIVLSDVDTAAGAAVTFFDTRGKVIFEVAVPAGPNGLSFVSVRFTGGERVARVSVRAGAEALQPGQPEQPQADVAAIDDVIFGEPLADEPPPVEPEFIPSEPQLETGPPAPALRSSLIPLSRKVRAGRTLKVVLGSSAQASATLTLGKVKRTLAAEAGATTVNLRVPAKAKKGKQKLRLRLVDAAGATSAKSVTITVN